MTLSLDELVAQPSSVNQRAQELDWEDLLFEYENALDDMHAWLRGLNDVQARFKPDAHVFSIAEVVTHNAFSDEMFWNWVKLLAQARAAEIDAKKIIDGDGARNDLLLAALEALLEACRTLARTVIETLPPTCDLASTVRHPKFGELNAKGWIYYMCLHHGLHLRQCAEVIDALDFPRSLSVQSQPREAYQPSERKAWLSETRGRGRGAKGKSQPRGRAPQEAGSKKQSRGGAPQRAKPLRRGHGAKADKKR